MTASSASSPRARSGVATGELSEWVNRVRSGSAASRSSNLEDEVRQSRLDRQQRASRLNAQPSRGGPSGSASQEVDTPTSLSDHEATSGASRLAQGSMTSPPSSQRGAALLARYGGQAGPTGTANAGSGGSPVSLASFMGGRASGPRLGKLAGDGRSAPPEASLIYESRSKRGVPLPGLSPTSPGSATAGGPGRSLASFLEARATGKESTPSSSPTASPRAPSPVKRASSPSKYSPSLPWTEDSGRPVFKAPASPTKRGASPIRDANALPALPSTPTSLASPKLSSRSIPQADLRSPAKGPETTSEMKSVATSPIKSDDISSSRLKSITASSTATPQGPSRGLSSTGQVSSPSPAASLRQASTTDKQPTPSLTRLQGKGMVGQRLKEAKEREAASSAASSPTTPGRLPQFRQNSSADSVPKWPSVDTSSPVREEPSRKWNPARSGNALPGLSSPASASASSPKREFASPTASNDDRFNVAPVRLPGLGNATSPFESRAGRASPEKEFATEARSSADSEQQRPLEHLTKARARGPARRSARTPGSTAEPEASIPVPEPMPVPSQTSPGSGAAAVPSTASVAPPRSTSGKRIVVLISGSGSNLQALIDATHISPPGSLAKAQIACVISNRKAAYGLQRAATANPPIPTEVLSLKTWQTRNPGETREQYDQVLAKAVLGGASQGSSPPDLVVLAGFMHIVSPQFLRALGHRTELSHSEAPAWAPRSPVPIVNLHPALPGAFDGANAIARAFEAFEQGRISHTGVMVHEVVAEVDRGAPVLVQQVPINRGDTLDALETRMHAVEHTIIVEATKMMLDRPEQIQAKDDGRTEAADKSATEKAEFVSVKNSIASWGSANSGHRSAAASMSEAPAQARAGSRPQSSYGSTRALAQEETITDDRDAALRWRQGNQSSVSAASAAPAHVREAESQKLAEQNAALEALLQDQPPTAPIPPTAKASSPLQKRSKTVQLSLAGRPATLPSLSASDRSVLDAAIGSAPTQRAQLKTLSVETLSIQADGSTVVVPPDQAHVLYDTETLAVVHRYKSTEGAETVSSALYARLGAQSATLSRSAPARGATSKQSRKLADLAVRFSTKIIDSKQGRESVALAEVLGGKLETRQGTRKSWDKNNTMLWRIASAHEGQGESALFIDQVDLAIDQLCSAYSYVASVVGTVFVWHGRGSTAEEREGAVHHARSVFGADAHLQEHEEGAESDTFWAFMDKRRRYGDAWHHRCRGRLSAEERAQRLFNVVSRPRGGGLSIQPHNGGSSAFSSSDVPADGVSLLLLPSEIYVLVGPEARSKRSDIAFGLSCGEHLAAQVAQRRLGGTSSSIPVHVLIYPSLQPRDMLLNLRTYWNAYDSSLVCGAKSMNVLSLEAAKAELLGGKEGRWRRELLQRQVELPLGIGPEDLKGCKDL